MKIRTYLSLFLQAVIAVCSTWGVILCASATEGFMGGLHVMLYFTIQSNIWIGLTSYIGIFLTLRGCITGNETFSRIYAVVKFVFTVAITLTGTVYCGILAPTLGDGAWALSQVLVHVIVPAASIADFLIFGAGRGFRYSDALFATIPPFYYLGFSAVGYVANWDFGGGANYPYFFMNWGSPAGAFGFSPELPFMGVFYWILVMVVIVVGFGLLFLRLVNGRKNA